MAKYASKDVGFALLGSYSMLGATSKFDDSVELVLNETYALGETDESFWSSGAKKTEIVQEGWFDDVVLGWHNAFVDLNVTPLPMTIAPHGNVINIPAAPAAGTEIDIYQSMARVGYTVQMATSEVTKMQARYGCWYGKKRGKLVAPLALRTTAGNTDTDDAKCAVAQPAGTNGGAAVLHITTLTGTPTNVTVTLRHSVDGVTYADKQAFNAFTPAQVAAGNAAQYMTFTGQINSWVSAAWAYTGGTTPNVTFAVGVYVAP
jgi:hypothetical protein